MVSSKRKQISNLQVKIGDESDLEDDVVELKSCDVAIDRLSEKSVIQYPTETDKHGQTYTISDDDNFIQVANTTKLKN